MEIGNKNEELILKSSGKIKVLWGDKFIDLLNNDGQLQTKDVFLSVSSVDEIVNDGIYLVNDESVYLCIDDKKFLISVK